MHYAKCKKPYWKGYTLHDFIYTWSLCKYKWNDASTYTWMCFSTQYCSSKPFGCLNSWKWNHRYGENTVLRFSTGWIISTPFQPEVTQGSALFDIQKNAKLWEKRERKQCSNFQELEVWEAADYKGKKRTLGVGMEWSYIFTVVAVTPLYIFQNS